MISPALRVVPSFNVANIPAELLALPQWVCWRYEQGDGSKPKKVPYSPRTNALASVTDRATWSSSAEAEAAASAPGTMYDGIGFVLTRDDPYAIIDLDDTEGDDDAFAVHRAIYDALDSYAELSPSGNGLHVVVRGAVETGRRRDRVELYSSDRYMTFTGNVYGEPRPIRDRQPIVEQLWHELASERRSDSSFDASAFYRAATADDDAVYAQAAASSNGEKFVRLWNGDGSTLPGGDKSGSALDMALVNILAFHTKDPAQIERLWLSSPQGQREKTRTRPQYRRDTIARAFDREAPSYDFPEITARIKAHVDKAKVAAQSAVVNLPPGLLPTIAASDLTGKAIVPRAWHVADMVPAKTVTLLSGDGGTGKSLAALQLAVATVAGLQWFGAAVRQGGSLFLTAEDDIDEVHRRLADIAAALRVPLDRLAALTLSSLAGRDAILAAPGSHNGPIAATALYMALRGHIAAHRPALIVLDTLADLFGGEENNRAQVRQFVGLLRTLALDFDAAVLLLAHPSLTGIANCSGLSGSTAWNNSVRSRLYMKRDPDDADVRILETMKSNYGAIGQQVRLRWQAGVFVEIGRTSNEPAHRVAAEAQADDVFLRLLADLTAQGQDVSPAPSSPTYAPKLFSARPGVTHKREGLAAAMNRLLAAGRIRIGKSAGAPSKQKDVLELASPGAEPAAPPANLLPAYAVPPASPHASPPSNSLPSPCCPPPIPP